MAKRMDTVTSHTKKLDEFQQALAHVNHQASQRISETTGEPSTPSRRRVNSGPKSAFSPTLKLKPTKSMDLPPALQDALRQAGVSFNQNSIESLQETLVMTQLEREQKLEDHCAIASSSTYERLAERLGKADVDLRAILDVLYSHTPFQQVNMTNPKLEEQIRKTEDELADADQKLLDAEANELSLNDPKVKAFIEKYGSST